ncbi:MAG: helix-turn-helix domain-containing protein, partial [Nitrospiria bacterium]
FHEDPELSTLYQTTLQKANIACETISYYDDPLKNTLPASGNRLILLETGKEDCHTTTLIQILKSDLKKTLLIIGSSKFLKKTLHHLDDLSHSVMNEGHEEGKPHKELYMEDFLESKLKAFIKKSYSAKKSHLYDTLLQEFERPLITLALKETNGNQIQAAEILGLNRNTLRKKIQDLKIPVKNLKKSS